MGLVALEMRISCLDHVIRRQIPGKDSDEIANLTPAPYCKIQQSQCRQREKRDEKRCLPILRENTCGFCSRNNS